VDFEVRVHDLRHAHASWLLAGGSDLKSVMDRMGHAQISDHPFDVLAQLCAVGEDRGQREGDQAAHEHAPREWLNGPAAM
jgi:site-specific recombinase XerC